MKCGRCEYENDDQALYCANCGTNLQPVMEEKAVHEGLTTIAAVQYAGFLRRFGAAIIDGILVYVVSYLLYYLLVIIAAGTASSSDSMFWEIVIIGAVVILILSPVYFIVMESSSKQATLGKMALGIIVTDREGKRISFWRSALRGIVKVISVALYGILLVVSCFTIVLTREKQALHDMLAGSRVMMKGYNIEQIALLRSQTGKVNYQSIMKQKQTSTLFFVLGIILALIAAFFMVYDLLPTALRIVILIIGISFIATAGYTTKARKYE